MHKSSISLFLAAVLFFSAAAHANDSVASISGGNIKFEKSDSIRMQSEVLTINPKRVRVQYEFFNETPKAISTTVVFPMPPLSDGDWGNGFLFDDFSVVSNGKTIKPKPRCLSSQISNFESRIIGTKFFYRKP